MIPEAFLENLDGMYPNDLRGYAYSLQELGHLNDEDNQTREKLVRYAFTKALAMEARAIGDSDALRHEHNCEVIYNELPQYAKW